MTRTRRTVRKPWGAVIGLLTACLGTLIGVASGLEPDVILFRAAVAGCVLGLTAAIVAVIWGLVLTRG
jgi:hypothetical protein